MDRTPADPQSAGSAAPPAAPPADRAVRWLRAVGRMLLLQPRWLAWLPPTAWAALIFFMSSFTLDLGVGDDSVGMALLHNLAHPGVFGILALLLVPVFPRGIGPGRRPWTAMGPAGGLWCVVLVGLYGFTDELHQSTVEGRDASLLDLAADLVGAACVVLVVRYLSRAEAADAGLRRLLLTCLVASIAAAGASTAQDLLVGEAPWPF